MLSVHYSVERMLWCLVLHVSCVGYIWLKFFFYFSSSTNICEERALRYMLDVLAKMPHVLLHDGILLFRISVMEYSNS